MRFRLPELPFDRDSLNPHLSPETMEYHYSRHHAAYVSELNRLLEASTIAAETLEEVIRLSQYRELSLYDNAAQAWNHTFYWHCLCSGGARLPPGPLMSQIVQTWGSLENLKGEFTRAALSFFGAGWIWLVRTRRGKLEIFCSSNGDSPLVEGRVPVLVCDLWEHAYYIDYRNVKASYLLHFWKIANWKFASANYERAGVPNMTQFMCEPPPNVAQGEEEPISESSKVIRLQDSRLVRAEK